MSDLREMTGSTKGSNEPKIPEKIMRKLDGLIKDFENTRDLLSTPVEQLGGETPPRPDNPNKEQNEWPELHSECSLLSIVDKIARLEGLEKSLRVYVDRLNELV